MFTPCVTVLLCLSLLCFQRCFITDVSRTPPFTAIVIQTIQHGRCYRTSTLMLTLLLKTFPTVDINKRVCLPDCPFRPFILSITRCPKSWFSYSTIFPHWFCAVSTEMEQKASPKDYKRSFLRSAVYSLRSGHHRAASPVLRWYHRHVLIICLYFQQLSTLFTWLPSLMFISHFLISIAVPSDEKEGVNLSHWTTALKSLFAFLIPLQNLKIICELILFSLSDAIILSTQIQSDRVLLPITFDVPGSLSVLLTMQKGRFGPGHGTINIRMTSRAC